MFPCHRSHHPKVLLIPQTDLSVGSWRSCIRVPGISSNWRREHHREAHREATAEPPRAAAEPPRGKCPAPGSQDSPDRAKGPSPESQKTDPLPPLKLGKWTPSGPKPRKRKNEKAIFGGIGELGLSGWRGSIRLVKLVWLVLPKKLGNGGKGPIYPKRS